MIFPFTPITTHSKYLTTQENLKNDGRKELME